MHFLTSQELESTYKSVGLPWILYMQLDQEQIGLWGLSLWFGISWQASVSTHACLQHPLTCFLSVLFFILSLSSSISPCYAWSLIVYTFHGRVYCFFCHTNLWICPVLHWPWELYGFCFMLVAQKVLEVGEVLAVDVSCIAALNTTVNVQIKYNGPVRRAVFGVSCSFL